MKEKCKYKPVCASKTECTEDCYTRTLLKHFYDLKEMFLRQLENNADYFALRKKYEGSQTKLKQIKELAEENLTTAQYGGLCRSVLQIIESGV